MFALNLFTFTLWMFCLWIVFKLMSQWQSPSGGSSLSSFPSLKFQLRPKSRTSLVLIWNRYNGDEIPISTKEISKHLSDRSSGKKLVRKNCPSVEMKTIKIASIFIFRMQKINCWTKHLAFWNVQLSSASSKYNFWKLKIMIIVCNYVQSKHFRPVTKAVFKISQW